MTYRTIAHRLASLPLVLLALALAAPVFAAKPDPELGRRLYETGIDRKGNPITGIDHNDISYEGEQAACLRCHRRSGFGGSEGGYYVPPIPKDFLYESSRSDRNDRFRAAFLEAQSVQHWVRVRMPRARPAYTDETLAAAIREGYSPGGQKFDALMPRYTLDDQDMANLIAHLKTLSAQTSPGVDDTFMHFAMVLSEGIDPGEREAMIRTTEAFFEWYNERLIGDKNLIASERVYGMQFRESTRLWKLHLWELKGDSKSWPRQLRSLYKKAPVFAMVNGMVAGSWNPIGEFCDEQKLPCLFPLTQVAQHTRDLGGYTIYYSRGLELEADLILQYLYDQGLASGRSIVQLHQAGPGGAIPAARFNTRIARMPGVKVETIAYTDHASLDKALDELAARGDLRHDVIIWPGDDAAAVDRMVARPELAATDIYTSSRAFEAIHSGAVGEAAKANVGRLIAAWPFSLPEDRHPDAYRVRAWMRSRALPVTAERIQFMSYYSLGILRDAGRHMFEHYHRDYLMERIEHEVDGAVNPGFYPNLELGPEQRFVSKGGYVVRTDAQDSSKIRAISPWMLP